MNEVLNYYLETNFYMHIEHIYRVVMQNQCEQNIVQMSNMKRYEMEFFFMIMSKWLTVWLDVSNKIK